MKLSIPNQCGESFDSFTSTSAGGFCQSCQKEVIDFRDMTDGEILAYFAQNRGKTCGSFRPAQLKTYNAHPQQHNRRVSNILGAGVLSFSLFTFLPFVNGQAQTQETITVSPVAQKTGVVVNSDQGYTIKGTLLTEDGEPIPGAVVLLKGTDRGMFTDDEGRFTFPDLRPGDMLQISYFGYESLTYTVPPATSGNDRHIKLTQTIRMSCPVIMGDVSVEGVYASKPSIWQRIGSAFR